MTNKDFVVAMLALMALCVVTIILLSSCVDVARIFWRDSEIATPEPTPRVESLDDLLPELEYDNSAPTCKAVSVLGRGQMPGGTTQNMRRDGSTPVTLPNTIATLAPPCVMQPRPRPCPAWDYHCDQTTWNWSKHWPQFGPPPSYGRWECVR